MTTTAVTPGPIPEQEILDDIPVWLQKLRDDARRRFSAEGYPTTHNEEWKYTNVSPLTKVRFQPGEYKLDGSIIASAAKLTAPIEAASVVFINGHYCGELSSSEVLPRGVKAGSLREALQEGDKEVTKHFGRATAGARPIFTDLNTASFHDGAFVSVPDGVVLEKPIHLVFLSVAEDKPTASLPRNLIVAGSQSQFSLIETYAGADDRQYFTNAVTEIVARENAVVHHHKVQREGIQAFHIANFVVEQARNSTVTCHSLSFGGALVRNDATLILSEGAEGTLNGLYVADGKQHVDNHTVIHHAKPHAASHELYKGVLNGRSSAVFNGKVIVAKDAQKTDAKQTNRNLVLSADAVINTKPELQIYADDVRCTHGATIGQLEENALFYLRSRGIGQDHARRLLIHAFAREIIDRIQLKDLRAVLDEELDARLRTYASEAA
jgi:Fe-S cluster assembly protein SufD